MVKIERTCRAEDPLTYIIEKVGSSFLAKDRKLQPAYPSTTDLAGLILDMLNDGVKTVGGVIEVPKGVHEWLGLPIPELAKAPGCNIRLKGEAGPKNCILRNPSPGTLDYMIDYAYTQAPGPWPSGTSKFIFENLRLEMDTKDANSRCLDLEYLEHDLINVEVENINATVRGYGIWTGDSDNPGNTKSPTWINVIARLFGRGIQMAHDHICAINPIAAFNVTNYRVEYGFHIALINPHSINPSGYHYVFDNPGPHVVLVAPSAEYGAGTGNPILKFWGATPKPITVIGGDRSLAGPDPWVAQAELHLVKFLGGADDVSIPFNRARGKTPTFTLWDTNPSNPGNMTDNAYSTESGEGVKTAAAAGDIGTIVIDLGAAHPVLVIAKVNAHRVSGDGSISCYIEASDDGVNFYSGGIGATSARFTDAYTSLTPTFLHARYFRLRFYANPTVSSVYHVKVAEIQAIHLNFNLS